MDNGFTSEFFAGNRARLRELFTGTAPIILTANGLVQQGADVSYPFRQDASFWYLTGIDEPDVVLVFDKDKEYLIVPKRPHPAHIKADQIDDFALKRHSGIDTIFDEVQGWKRLSVRLEKVKHVATLPAPISYTNGMYANPARQHLMRKLKSHNEHLEFLDINQHIAHQRMIKQASELKAIQAAIDITVAGIKEAKRSTRRNKYGYEYEVEAEITRTFRRLGAQGHAFPPIIAGGNRACILGYNKNDNILSADELLLCDTGAMYGHYTADIARTVSLGTPTRRQEAVHAAVLEIREFAIALLQPGASLKSYEQQVEELIGEKLRELGLIKTIEHETVRQFAPHATAHFLGIDAHDVGIYERSLEPGMVLAIEAGIYSKDEAIGVRIEDDVLITAEGARILSDKLSLALT